MKPGTCKHFNGIGADDQKRCLAGVCYRSHVGGSPSGWALRLPCRREYIEGLTHAQREEVAKAVPCSRYEEPTAREIEVYEAKLDALLRRMEKSIPLLDKIKADHADTDWSGTVQCPVCSGRLHVGISAFNGHTRGRCETPNCLSWIE